MLNIGNLYSCTHYACILSYSDEDKKAIGTIRRYGSGADVIIMYGGLIAEIDEGNEEPDAATVQKYMTRTMDSLDEVIAICKNSGGFV